MIVPLQNSYSNNVQNLLQHVSIVLQNNILGLHKYLGFLKSQSLIDNDFSECMPCSRKAIYVQLLLFIMSVYTRDAAIMPA